VSWSEDCASPNYPGVYTDVAYYKEWVEGHLRKSKKELRFDFSRCCRQNRGVKWGFSQKWLFYFRFSLIMGIEENEEIETVGCT